MIIMIILTLLTILIMTGIIMALIGASGVFLGFVVLDAIMFLMIIIAIVRKLLS